MIDGATAQTTTLSLSQMLFGALDKARPRQELSEAIPRPRDIWQPISGALVRQANSDKRVFVGWIGAACSYIAPKRAHAEWS